ncbi:multiple resistance and pH regulation protein F [Aquisalimonas sp. 2447]|uniref:monovalent cation/H+ antiporter complex subunit F n=1 Tax=Aquisalimonas sp. 2447 TaxID=2740807 RepID=UPI0014326AA2|nr:monovalent cation/H+ antiporter complex subunit F [Aquisalimonas sp. 2447]QIT54802.1 multiple resistance and pH regulation protein F [Aquisalimonas sp. 2447]
MSMLLTSAAVILLALFGLGLIQVFRGPTRADRMLAIQLAGTSMVAILLVLSQILAMPALVDAALIFMLFAALVATAFVRRPRTDEDSQ